MERPAGDADVEPPHPPERPALRIAGDQHGPVGVCAIARRSAQMTVLRRWRPDRQRSRPGPGHATWLILRPTAPAPPPSEAQRAGAQWPIPALTLHASRNPPADEMVQRGRQPSPTHDPTDDHPHVRRFDHELDCGVREIGGHPARTVACDSPRAARGGRPYGAISAVFTCVVPAATISVSASSSGTTASSPTANSAVNMPGGRPRTR